MSHIEETRAAVSKGRETFKSAFDHNRQANGRIGVTEHYLYDAVKHLGKTLRAVQEARTSLGEACGHNKDAAEDWRTAFVQLIGAGAAQSERKEVITALAHAQHEGGQVDGRQGILEANLEKLVPFVGVLQAMLQTVEKDILPEMTSLERSSRDFTRDQIEIDDQWQTGPGIVDMRALWNWEQSL